MFTWKECFGETELEALRKHNWLGKSGPEEFSS
jgi:hypothetical protein